MTTAYLFISVATMKAVKYLELLATANQIGQHQDVK
jgi:hypothetical protein